MGQSKILPYTRKMIEGLGDSAEKLEQMLDEELLIGKYGEDCLNVPHFVREYYQASGYLGALTKISTKKKYENQEISCDIAEMISQEICKNLDEIIKQVINHPRE